MKRVAPLGLVLALGLFFSWGCGGSSSSAPKTGQLRVVNAVYDAFAAGQTYDVLADSVSLAASLAYNTPTGYGQVASGSHTIEVRNSGTSADLISNVINIAGGSSYTYVIGGAGVQPSPILLTDNSTAATSGNIQFRIINADAAFGAMDVFFVPNGTDLFTVTANDSGLGFGGTGGYHTVTAGTYAIYVTQAGTKTPQYLYSGAIDFKSGAVTTFVITGPGNAPGWPLSLIQLTDVAGSTK